MKKTDASWELECHVDCPYCDAFLDLTSEIDDWYEALPTPLEVHKNCNVEVECPSCGKDFIVDNFYY